MLFLFYNRMIDLSIVVKTLESFTHEKKDCLTVFILPQFVYQFQKLHELF